MTPQAGGIMQRDSVDIRWIGAIAYWLAIMAALATAAYFLSRIGMFLPSWGTVLPYLCLAVLSLYLAVVIEDRRRWAILGWGWIVIPLLAALLLWLAWRFQVLVGDWDKRTPLGRAELVAAGFALLVVVPRFAHLFMAALRRTWLALSWSGQGEINPGHFEGALPSHQSVVNDLLAETGADRLAPAPSTHPKTIALRGCWGAGKTACLRLFQAQAGERGTVAVVWFDCWRNQSDSQPEFSLYWAVAQEWSVLWPWGWTQVPVLRAYLTWLPLVIKATWKFGPMEMSLDDKALKDPPRAQFWQRHLGGLVRHALIRRRRVVVVLEDIDRCAAVAAQRYVTLVRRFLAVPGVTIIIPHVEDQLRTKVFDPLNAQLPDLAATTTSVLWGAFRQAALTKETLARIGKLADAGGDTAELANENIMRAIRPSLLLQFTKAPEAIRHRVFAVLEDKYLCDQIVVLPSLRAKDCAYLIVDAVRNRPEWRGKLPDDAMAQIAGRLSFVIDNPLSWSARLMARQFSGALSQVLNEAGPKVDAAVDAAPDSAQGDGAVHLLSLLGRLAYAMAVERTEDALMWAGTGDDENKKPEGESAGG